MAAEKKKGGLAGLLLLGKSKMADEGDDEEAPPSSQPGGIEEEYFSRAYDALKANNQDAFASALRKGVEACVEKAKSGDYEE
jgi:hypothetical protein